MTRLLRRRSDIPAYERHYQRAASVVHMVTQMTPKIVEVKCGARVPRSAITIWHTDVSCLACRVLMKPNQIA